MNLGHRIESAQDALRFIMAGKANFSLRSAKSGTHFTYKVKAPRGDVTAPVRFVSVLRGADNEGDYSYIGFIRNGQFLHGGQKSHAGRNAPSVVAFGWAWRQMNGGQLAEQLEVYHAEKCGHCGKKLTTPESIATGLGPTCSEKLGVERAQLERAPAA